MSTDLNAMSEQTDIQHGHNEYFYQCNVRARQTYNTEPMSTDLNAMPEPDCMDKPDLCVGESFRKQTGSDIAFKNTPENRDGCWRSRKHIMKTEMTASVQGNTS